MTIQIAVFASCFRSPVNFCRNPAAEIQFITGFQFADKKISSLRNQHHPPEYFLREITGYLFFRHGGVE